MPAATSDASSADLEDPRIRQAVEKLYTRVATDPDGKFDFHRGAEYAVTKLGYDRAEIAAIPEAATRSFAGVANPHVIDPLRAGETVLDVGSGSGTDLLLAAHHVGPRGRAIGVDMTEEMVKRCHASIAELGLENVEVRCGSVEHLPLDDAMVDAVISNGVLNLVPDKAQALREIYRVLRPGGRLLLGDIVVSATFLQKVIRNADLWAVCVSGALKEEALVELITKSGFERTCVTQRFDCIQGTSKEFFARWFGVRGMNLHAVKPVS